MNFKIYPILGDFLHWSVRLNNKHFNFGYYKYGNCWTFKYEKGEFYNCVVYRFWRLFLGVDKIK